MIPDKIYIQMQNGKTITTNRIFATDVEYIRKDALLEWLNQMLEISAQSFEFQRNYAYGKVIDKLNEM